MAKNLMLRRVKLSGFTLIEMLVTLAILTMIIALAATSFSFFSRHWDKAEQLAKNQEQQTLDILRLQNLIGGVTDFYLRENDNLQLLFLGFEREIIAVTSNPMSYHPGAALFRLRIQSSEDDEKPIIHYQEWSLIEHDLNTFDDLSLMLDSQGDFSYRFRFSASWFEFLGVESFESFTGGNSSGGLETDRYRNQFKWQKIFNGTKILVLPAVIKLSTTEELHADQLWFSIRNYNEFKQGFMQ